MRRIARARSTSVEKGAGVKIERSGRGRFRLLVEADLDLAEK